MTYDRGHTIRESDLFTHGQALCSLKLKDQILHPNYVIFIIRRLNQLK